MRFGGSAGDLPVETEVMVGVADHKITRRDAEVGWSWEIGMANNRPMLTE